MPPLMVSYLIIFFSIKIDISWWSSDTMWPIGGLVPQIPINCHRSNPLLVKDELSQLLIFVTLHSFTLPIFEVVGFLPLFKLTTNIIYDIKYGAVFLLAYLYEWDCILQFITIGWNNFEYCCVNTLGTILCNPHCSSAIASRPTSVSLLDYFCPTHFLDPKSTFIFHSFTCGTMINFWNFAPILYSSSPGSKTN